MIAELKKQANDVIQSMVVDLNNAVEIASKGGDYGEHWEAAMRNQAHLLRIINEMKYKVSSKPRSFSNEETGTI